MWGKSVLWSGIITNCSISYNDQSFSINAVDWLHYFEKRLCPTLSFKQIDQMKIIRSLLATANDINLIIDAPKDSGKLRTQNYHEEDGDDIFSRLDNLSHTKDGFFYFCYYKIKNDILHKYLKIIYPRAASNNKYKLMQNVNCEISEVGYQGMYLVTRGTAFSSLQNDRFISTTMDQPSDIFEQYPLIEKKWKFDDIADEYNLKNKLIDKMHMYSRPHQYFRCSTFFNENMVMQVGDEIELFFEGQTVECIISDIKSSLSDKGIEQEIELKELDFIEGWTR